MLDKLLFSVVVVMSIVCGASIYSAHNYKEMYVKEQSDNKIMKSVVDEANSRADELKKDLEIANKTIKDRDDKYRSIEAESSKNKKKVEDVKNDKCIDENVPSGLFGHSASSVHN